MTKQQTIIIASVGVGLFAAVIGVLLRGYFRETLIPMALRPVYAHSINTAYNEASQDITAAFSSQPLKTSPVLESTANCYVNGYEGFGIDISCSRAAGFGVSDLSPEFLASWKQHASGSEQYLLDHGWQKQWNSQQPIAEIFNTPDRDVSIGVVYSKQVGKTSCELSMYYSGDHDPDYDGLNANLLCSRELHIFDYNF